MNFLRVLLLLARCFLVNRCELLLENLALRQQLAVLNRKAPRPRLRAVDRWFWVGLSRYWARWRSVLLIVSPATVVGWHRQGFRWYWRWKSPGKPGRPPIALEARRLIRRLSEENSLWGAPRIQAELRLLGHDLALSTVAKYMTRRPKRPSSTWRAFLKNHVGSLAAIDFFVVPTAAFQLLYVLVVLRHDRRRVVHFNVTTRPTPEWVAQQLANGFPPHHTARYLIRDRDGVYRGPVMKCLQSLGIEEVVIAPRSPWQNPFVERLIGTLRRECLDHVIVLNEAHLKRILAQYLDYYHNSRPHQSLDANSPNARGIQPPDQGEVIAIPQVGGLHHRYQRVA